MRLPKCSPLPCLTLLLPLVALAGPGPGPAAGHKPGPGGRTAASWPTAEARGLETITGLLHLHSPYSHDACNYDPLTPEGTPKPECVESLRESICIVPRNFFMLTDHRTHMADQAFEDLFLYDAARGDTLIYGPDGSIIANEITCSDAFNTWTTWLYVGLEGDHNMPVGLEEHLDDFGNYGVGFGIDQDYNAQVDEIEDIHAQNGLALVAHMEEDEVTSDRLLGLEIDGIELYNAHSNINVILEQHILQLLWMEPWLEGAENAPESDYVALIMYPLLDQAPVTKWDLMTPVRPTPGVIGTDVHENVTLGAYCADPALERLCARLERTVPNFVAYLREGGPIPMADGERLDSYVRMFRWFSNHVRGRFDEPRDVKAAIRAGSSYVSFDILGMPDGFDFVASSDLDSFTEMGGITPFLTGLKLYVTLPGLATVDVRGESWTEAELEQAEIRAELKRVDEGGTSTVATLSRGRQGLDYEVTGPGVYRVEVYIRPHHLERELGSQARYAREEYLWIWSNPIYVK